MAGKDAAERPSLSRWAEIQLKSAGLDCAVQVVRTDNVIFLLCSLERKAGTDMNSVTSSTARQLFEQVRRRLDPSITLQGVYWTVRDAPPIQSALVTKHRELSEKLQDLRMRRTDLGLGRDAE